MDGGYTNKKTIAYVTSKCSHFYGYIGRFGKNRLIKAHGFEGSITKFCSALSVKDFHKIQVGGNEKLVYTVSTRIYKGEYQVNLLLIIDDVNKPQTKNIRALVTNMMDLSPLEIATHYSYRWQEETYHQVIKDAFHSRTHKLRKLSTFSRYLQVINTAYGLCETRRHRKHSSTKTIFGVKNELLVIAKKQFILNLRGNQIPKVLQDKVLAKFLS